MEEQKTNSKPTETVSLPSKGLIYPQDNPLSKGSIEMYYMSAAHEDILTNENYIKQEIVIDKLLQALIATKINYDDLIVGDKDAILIAARILGYGSNYKFDFKNPITDNKEQIVVDLSELEDKLLDESLLVTKGVNEFSYELPSTGDKITFKLLTHGDDKNIRQELKGLKKINPNASYEITTRLRHMITSVNGNRDQKTIRDFVGNNLLARDSRALREHVKQISPGVIMEFNYDSDGYAEEGISIPMTVDFFWPR